jgi:hypothetical protein
LQAKALQNRPDLRAAVLGVTAANSQYALAKANGKQDPTISANYSHVNGISTATWSFSIPLAIFDRNQGNIAQTRIAIRQAEEQQKAASGQVLTDVKDAYEALQESRENSSALEIHLSRHGPEEPRYQRIRVPARRHCASRFPGRRADLSRHPTRLSPGGGGLPGCIGAASPGGGNEEPALIPLLAHCTRTPHQDDLMTREEIRARIEEIGIIPAIRVSSAEDALFAAEAVSESAIPIVEVTMTVPGAVEVIRELTSHHPDVLVGAGTLFRVDTARRCLDAGAGS